MATALGKQRVSDVRENEYFHGAIAEVTGLGGKTVSERLEAAHGRTRVRKLFADAWPWQASTLAERTAAFARDYDLREEIGWVTGATTTLVTRRLNGAAGRKQLRNLFWDVWPAADAPPPRTAQVEAESDDAPAGESEDAAPDTLRPPPPGNTGVGSVLSGRYTLQRILGTGGFGTTWEAHDRISDLVLVVKLPNDDDASAIQRELRTAFRLVHGNICQAFPERDDDTGQPFLVLQHGGESLRDRLDKMAEPFPHSLAMHSLLSVADALDYLHENLVVHLDVSPSNVLIDEDDVVRLTDFGASASARETARAGGGHTVIATTVSQLNPIYAAPELQQGEGRARSDQYSLAMLLCSLLEGRIFVQRYRFQGLAQLSAAQNVAVHRALSQHPEDRFESCGSFARAVADAADHVPVSVLATDLDRLSRDLIHRFQREIDRGGGATVRLGGTVKLGRGIERLLHATVLWMAAADGFDAESALRKVDPKTQGLARATAGRIAKTILACADSPSASRPEIGVILTDLSAKDSRLWKLINVRNEVVHGTAAADAVLGPAANVAALLREQRRAAGWAPIIATV